MPIRVRWLPSNVQAERLKGGRASLSAFQPPDTANIAIGKGSENMPRNASPRSELVDQLPALVESRFRFLKGHGVSGDDQSDERALERRVDGQKRRARRLDERIVRTVATSKSGLLAQIRLLAAFYEESTNGAGRRGSLLMETIATGIERLDGSDSSDASDRNTQTPWRSPTQKIGETVYVRRRSRRLFANCSELNTFG